MFLFSGSPSRRKHKERGEMQFETLLKKVRGKGLMVRTDSREVQPGDCFVALPGTSVRGMDFIPAALDNGAEYLVAPDSARDLVAPVAESRAAVIYHDNTAIALGELARAYFHVMDREIKLVAITGTNGKTTTSYIIEHLLSCAGLKVGVLGTVNYRWPGFSIDAKLTTPGCWMTHELLSNMKEADVDVAIMEVSSHALDQYRVAGLDFDAAVLTNVTQDHLDYHGDMETYFSAKAKLFREYPRMDKAGVVNFNDPFGRRLLEENPEITAYGLGDHDLPEAGGKPRNAVQGRMLSCTGQGIELETTWKGKTWTIHSPLIGAYNAANLLAAQAVGLHLGLSCKDMRCLADFHGVPGRLERVKNEKNLPIFVDYAHTPDALENVQKTLKELDFDRLITVFGCGGDRDRAKRPLMAKAVARWADVAVLTSDNPRTEDPIAIMDDARPGLEGSHEVLENPDRQTAINLAVAAMNQNDVLLIAGKGHEDYQIIGTDRIDFSDKTAVLRALGEVE
ncbi:UDP-N-acetylmuramoyl-L-alanyl-D-glutamate--2,6-diaminopimelate ligase [Pseudodesulfovibrio tunisiensis]|uniref:UDP-N-acetylmuramoyl-L-alanyl-D-glutamate--2, 6-diaminopimelate ligase n=1 Tax=Pseudodesulfovibrio tunisiensis TaxID=463192 RepID=UPI001FB4EAB4|nr:UDP-N-acetylmuramoyl-L-alanyl-D-glutamate--2,6-diaminopimelate ligase [Pseudodesulfovibrio tunisiensis]